MDDKKICGILIENRLQSTDIKDCIIGIGLNVNQTVFKSDAPNPVSIRQLTGKETDLNELLKAFLDCFDKECNNKTTCFTARLTDVLPDGRLLLVDKEGREHTYAFKEVQFII